MSHCYLPLSLVLLLSLRMEKKAMKSGGWKTPGVTTVATKVTQNPLAAEQKPDFFDVTLIVSCQPLVG